MKTESKTELIDVLVVGGGPTGTALAIDLTRRGLAVRIIDKAAKSSSSACRYSGAPS